MQEILLVGNPARRRKSTKPASPAQKRARAAFAAAARARANPAKRRKTRTVKRAAAPAAARRSRRRVSRRIRRNPIGSGGSNIMRSITPRLKNAAIGGLGAFGVDVAYGYAQQYLPDAIKSPIAAEGGINFLYYAAKGAAALGIGILANKVIGSQKAGHLVDASLTVTAHDLIKHFAASNLSTVPVGAMPGGRILPPLPQSQTLRKYARVGETAMTQGVRSLRAYPDANMRESVTR